MIIEKKKKKMSEKVGNKYKLCILASKRALEIQVANIENKVEPEQTELKQAAKEIWSLDSI
mgnify:CR=1 FL=1